MSEGGVFDDLMDVDVDLDFLLPPLELRVDDLQDEMLLTASSVDYNFDVWAKDKYRNKLLRFGCAPREKGSHTDATKVSFWGELSFRDELLFQDVARSFFLHMWFCDDKECHHDQCVFLTIVERGQKTVSSALFVQNLSHLLQKVDVSSVSRGACTLCCG